MEGRVLWKYTTIFHFPSLRKIRVEYQQAADVYFLSIDLLFCTVATRKNSGHLLFAINYPSHKDNLFYFFFQHDQLLYLVIDL